MLLQYTRKCHEMCTHCMVDALPDGQTMSKETLVAAVKYANDSGARTLVVTGGEFTSTDTWYDDISYIIKNFSGVIILESNGSWVNSVVSAIRMRKILQLDNVVCLQISTHEKYYPNYKQTMAAKSNLERFSKKIYFCEGWQGNTTNIKCLGRAKNLNLNATGNPGCSPMISYARNFPEHTKTQEYLGAMEFNKYMCKPMISVEGNVHVGETQYCTVVDSVHSPDIQGLYHRIRNLHFCDKCNTRKNVDAHVLKALGL